MQRLAVFVATGLVASSAIALADDDAPPSAPMEAGVYAGGFVSNYFHQFYDLPTFRNMPGGPAARPVLDQVAPMLGLRYALFMSDYVGLEADGSWTLESTQGGGDSVRIFHVGGTLLGQLPVSGGKLIPFAGLGWGIWDSQSDALGSAVHFPVHVQGGARYFITDSIALRADVRYYRGPANRDPYTLGAGYAEFNIGVSWVPHLGPSTPSVEHVDGDADNDGIPDSKDACPNEPEDKDMFMDDDGCPDPDNDGDGIADAQDKCPLDPEDYDGFQDADGCPDVDNDGDTIPDAMDSCPNEPEDKDGYRDLDGCPDPDNDSDGIADGVDKCPNEPETINGVQDDDGCPDHGDSLVVLSPERLELLDAFQFARDKLNEKKTANLLGQIAATLRAHAEIARLRITVYVQPTRNPDKDQQLSDNRASSIRDALIERGVEPKRLVARGFGGEKPLVSPDQKGAAAMNDRVDLIILERK
ncbi:MAG: OmpA family protein [Acidobacteriota bacterium]